jgi:hypothetical protein
MKSLLLAALLVAILVVILMRPWVRGPLGPTAVPADQVARFMRDCTAVSSAMHQPEAYCRCLLSKGVTSPAQTMSQPSGRAAAAECVKTTSGAAIGPKYRGP